MDVTMIGLQNAGKSSLLRVLAVSPLESRFPFPFLFLDFLVFGVAFEY
jgi:GTPase involved in cell partitioning and DNA repair